MPVVPDTAIRAACRLGLEGLVSKRRDRRRVEALGEGEEKQASGDMSRVMDVVW
jgi:acylphosphatase